METRLSSVPKPIHERALEAGISGITKKDVRDLAEKARRIMKGIQGDALRDIFGPELDALQQPGASEHATNLFAPLLNDIFDKGTNRDVRCEVPYGKGFFLMHEKAVPIYARSSFISKILHEEDRINKGLISMGRIDLERFRDADFDVGNKKGIRPADVIINTTANAIREALQEVWKTEKLDTASNSYEVGRYGGDELIIAFIGEQAQLCREKVMHLLVDTLSKKNGFYKNAKGEVEAIPIRLKKNAKGEPVEWINLPSSRSDEEKTMYKEYLQRGLIISESDFERDKRKYSSSGVFDFSAYRKDYPENDSVISYPDHISGTKEKIAHLSVTHPEFALYFGIAEVFDREDETDITQIKRQKKLLSVVENSIFDKLLGEMIYSKVHFMKHMNRDEIGELYMVDFKQLKEKNTAMTYADADDSIKMLWDRIKSSIPQEERHKLIIGRFAGADCIGVRKGQKLSDGCRAKLNTITSLPFDKNTNYSVPLGHAYLNLADEANKGLASYQILNKIEEESDKAFYLALGEDIQKEQRANSQFMTKVAAVDLDNLIKRDYQPLSKIELYALYLRGSRKGARMNKFLDTLPPDSPLRNYLWQLVQ